jgi:hypothetical protein
MRSLSVIADRWPLKLLDNNGDHPHALKYCHCLHHDQSYTVLEKVESSQLPMRICGWLAFRKDMPQSPDELDFRRV